MRPRARWKEEWVTPRGGTPSTAQLWDDLRASWAIEPAILIEQISFLLALKRLTREGNPPLAWRGRTLRWDRLSSMTNRELVTRLGDELIPFVSASMPPSIRPTMKEARFAFEDPKLLKSCLWRIDQVDAASEGRFFEGLLAQLDGGDRQLTRTPPAVAAAMVDLVEPRPGDSICDPAAGSGGLLLEAAKRAGPQPGVPGAKLHGFDINPGKARLAAFNLMFHDVADPRIEQADVLASDFNPSKFDVVLCAPPFGGTRGDEEVDADLVEAGNRTELLYLERCRKMQRGNAAILLPEAVLFGRSGKFVRARREWLQRRLVTGVVLLPPGLLGFTNIRSAILVASYGGTTEEVWFCPLADKSGPGAGGKRADVQSRLECVAEAFRSRLRGEEPRRPEAVELATDMFSAPIEKIKDNNWSLAPGFYRDAEVPETQENPRELLQEIEAVESEIDRLLTDAGRLLAEPEPE